MRLVMDELNAALWLSKAGDSGNFLCGTLGEEREQVFGADA
jgi:hypothetical protein